jgi:hypothetical protein
MNTLYYLLEANVYLVVLYGFYRLFLRKETFHSLNRTYFLLTPAIAFILPSFRISGLHADTAPVVYSQAVSLAKERNNDVMITYLLCGVYLAVAVFFLARLARQLHGLSRIIAASNKQRNDGINLVTLKETSTSFSFLNYLFIQSEATKSGTIIRHEKVHIDQLHSIDILYYELLRALNWFNPVILLMQKEIKAIHEFIADEHTSREEESVGDYAMFLIHHSGAVQSSRLVNPIFSQSLLKERILRLSQERSPRSAALKYALLLLLLPMMVLTTSGTFKKSYGAFDLAIGSIKIEKPRTYDAHRAKNTFSIGIDTTKKKRLPPPPPEPPRLKKNVAGVPPAKSSKPTVKTDQVRFPQPAPAPKETVKKVDQVRFAPPRPPKPKKYPAPALKSEAAVKAPKVKEKPAVLEKNLTLAPPVRKVNKNGKTEETRDILVSESPLRKSIQQSIRKEIESENHYAN